MNSIDQTEPSLPGLNDHCAISLCKTHRKIENRLFSIIYCDSKAIAEKPIWFCTMTACSGYKFRLKIETQSTAECKEAGSSNQCHGDEMEIPQTFSAPAHKTRRTVTEAFS